jgi:hypothetical protein
MNMTEIIEMVSPFGRNLIASKTPPNIVTMSVGIQIFQSVVLIL